jgi:hypothetical protein
MCLFDSTTCFLRFWKKRLSSSPSSCFSRSHTSFEFRGFRTMWSAYFDRESSSLVVPSRQAKSLKCPSLARKKSKLARTRPLPHIGFSGANVASSVQGTVCRTVLYCTVIFLRSQRGKAPTVTRRQQHCMIPTPPPNFRTHPTTTSKLSHNNIFICSYSILCDLTDGGPQASKQVNNNSNNKQQTIPFILQLTIAVIGD